MESTSKIDFGTYFRNFALVSTYFTLFSAFSQYFELFYIRKLFKTPESIGPSVFYLLLISTLGV